MAIVVEHDKRKYEILEKSLELFCSEGYDDVTFQKIADACGITRTTLYIYFKNKKEIFNFSIKQLSNTLEKRFLAIIKDKDLNSEQCLRNLMNCAVDVCAENVQLFTVIFPYLLGLKKSGADIEDRIKRRTIRMQHLMSTVVIRGQKSNEFKQIPIKHVNDMLFSLVEAAVFKISLYNQDDIQNTKISINLAIDGLLNR